MSKQQKSSYTTLEIGLSSKAQKAISQALSVIESYTQDKHVVVAFSGGMDSTLALLLTKEVKKDIIAVHIDWGDFTYPSIRKRVKDIVQRANVPLHIIYKDKELEKLAYRGISCNTCTKKIKLGSIKEYYPHSIIITGANQSDSWGKGGTYFNPPYLAPLKDIDKQTEMEILKYKYGITEFHIGVHPEREGCMLRHLWTPDKDGTKAPLTATVNRLLIDYLDGKHIPHHLVNVKVIGTKRQTKLIVNVIPHLNEDEKVNITALLEKYGEVLWGENLSEITVVINPSLDNPSGRASIEAIIRGELGNPQVQITFIRSKYDFIRLFQVVDAS